MKKFVIVALLVGLATPAFAEGPIAAAAQREAQTAAVQNGKSGGNGRPLMWAGLGLAAGGGTLAALAASVLKTETCGLVGFGYSYIAGCVEETNKGLLWTGIGTAAGGAALMAIGASKNVQVGPGTISYKHSF